VDTVVVGHFRMERRSKYVSPTVTGANCNNSALIVVGRYTSKDLGVVAD